MTLVTLIGAGGKMGVRLTDNLKDSAYQMSYLEVSPEGIEKIKSKGLDVSIPEDVIPKADVLIFAVPDVLVKKITLCS
jgi:ketol-acid reductoisomerase